MDADRWERIQQLFHAALERPSAERAEFLAAAAPDDPKLQAEVAELLSEDAAADSLLDRDLADVAGEVLDAGDLAGLPQGAFGPYRIVRRLGHGGMGVVYLAERADLGRLAAVKILRDAWLSPERRQRFTSEQRTLAQLNHPSIARLYDAGVLPDGTPWFVMEYVEGLTLTDHCAQHGLDINQRLALLRQVGEAVQHAHRHAVIHRDLKPSNILVTGGGEVKLLDFGIAKPLEEIDSAADHTRTGLKLLTPAYAAPEQLSGGRLGVHTDVYSLGVILYELLTGRPPFDLSNQTPGEVEATILRRDPERPSAAAQRAVADSRERPAATRGRWADLDVLCLTALHKDPERRYRTVEALLRDIDHFLAGEPLEARPDSFGYRLDKFVRRRWRPLAAGALGLAVLAGSSLYYTIRLVQARNLAVAEALRTQRIQRFMTDLFEGGDPDAGPSDSLRVITLLGRGIQEAQSLGAEPAIQSELYQTLGVIFQKLGDLNRADSLVSLALALRAKPGAAGTRADRARSELALGMIRLDQSQLAAADSLVSAGLARARRLEPADPGLVARAGVALGMVYEGQGAYDRAIGALNEALQLHTAAGSPGADLSATLSELANCHFYAGRYAVSDSLNRRALAIDRALYGPHHPHVGNDLINLGAIQFELAHTREAEAYFRQALEIYESWYGPEHFEVASTLTMLGRTLVSDGRNAEAVPPLRRALALRERIYGRDSPSVASTLNELGRIALAEKRLDEAEADFRRMADIYRAVYHDKHYWIGVALSNLGGVMLERSRPKEAEALFREVIRRYEETLSPDHLYVGITRIKLGRALLRQERYAEAEHESRAGYDRLAKETDPGARWLQYARTDLAAECRALGHPAEALRFEAELADSGRSRAAGGSPPR